MKTSTKVIIGIIVAAFLLLVWVSIGPSSNASERKTTSIQHQNGATMRTWVDRTWDLCPHGGALRGWSLDYTDYGPWPGHPRHYKFGTWSGNFCSGPHVGITSVDWGGTPQGHTYWWPWEYHPGDTHIERSDNHGPWRYRKWRGHFSADVGAYTRHDFPWMTVQLTAGQPPYIRSGCGC